MFYTMTGECTWQGCSHTKRCTHSLSILAWEIIQTNVLYCQLLVYFRWRLLYFSSHVATKWTVLLTLALP